MRSLWLVNELGLDVEIVTHGFGGDLRTPEYMAIHPLGRVPALQIDDKILLESGAITEILCEEYDDGTLYRAPDHLERAQWLQWVHYAETITVHVTNLTQQFIALESPELRSPIIIKLEKRRLEKALQVIEDCLKKHNYMLASGFSAADISIGYSLYVAKFFTDLDKFPKTTSYYKCLTKRPAFQNSLPAPNYPQKLYRSTNYALVT